MRAWHRVVGHCHEGIDAPIGVALGGVGQAGCAVGQPLPHQFGIGREADNQRARRPPPRRRRTAAPARLRSGWWRRIPPNARRGDSLGSGRASPRKPDDVPDGCNTVGPPAACASGRCSARRRGRGPPVRGRKLSEDLPVPGRPQRITRLGATSCGGGNSSANAARSNGKSLGRSPPAVQNLRRDRCAEPDNAVHPIVGLDDPGLR